MLAVLGSLVVCLVAGVQASQGSRNPYHLICKRNVFALRAWAEPPVQPEPLPPLPKVLLNGITTILGDKRALLEIKSPAGPGQPPKTESCILAEGQRVGPIEILEVDERAGCVTLNNSGTVMLLTFERSGSPTPPPPSPGRTPANAK